VFTSGLTLQGAELNASNYIDIVTFLYLSCLSAYDVITHSCNVCLLFDNQAATELYSFETYTYQLYIATVAYWLIRQTNHTHQMHNE
jgi:hypothetical protein